MGAVIIVSSPQPILPRHSAVRLLKPIDCICVIFNVIYIRVLNALVRFSVNSRIEHDWHWLHSAKKPSRLSSLQLVIPAALSCLRSLISALALVVVFLFNHTIWPQQGVHIINLENSHHVGHHPDLTSFTLFGILQSTRNGYRLFFAGRHSFR